MTLNEIPKEKSQTGELWDSMGWQRVIIRKFAEGWIYRDLSKATIGITSSVALKAVNGSTAFVIETPDSILYTLLLIPWWTSFSILILAFEIDQERRTDPRSWTNNTFPSANGEPISLLFPTPWQQPPPPAFSATWKWSFILSDHHHHMPPRS